MSSTGIKRHSWLSFPLLASTTEPWSRARTATVVKDDSGWRLKLVDDDGVAIADEDIQGARLVGKLEEQFAEEA